jgi:uncharacterized membrane protein YcaP (DUF421 family)
MATFEMIVRTVIVFILLYILSRGLGKKLISQMNFFDFVAGISIGSITASIMFSKEISLLTGLVGLSVFCLITYIIDISVLKSFTLRKILNSEPTLIIKDGRILETGMKKVRLSIDELLMLLRRKGVFYLDEVEIALFETDGALTVLLKPNNKLVTCGNLQLQTTSRGLAQAFIIDGAVMKHSLTVLGKDLDWVHSLLKLNGLSTVEEVVFAQIDQLGNVYIDSREDSTHSQPI